jgi:hypothetical protein
VATHIGVIAEDDSDVATLYELTCKLVRAETFKFRKFVGRGCGKLRRKCRPWAVNLRAKGCEHLVVMHDLDEREETDLRQELERLIEGTGFSSSLVLIPIREIEAWLLCDRPALKAVFGTPRLPKLPSNPETITDPKAEMETRVRNAGGSLYVHTVHNMKIARACKVQVVEDRCSSFKPYVSFIRGVVGTHVVPRGAKSPTKRSKQYGRER